MMESTMIRLAQKCLKKFGSRVLEVLRICEGLIAQQVAQVRNYLHSLLGWYGSILRIFNNCLCQHGDVAVHTLENVLYPPWN